MVLPIVLRFAFHTGILFLCLRSDGSEADVTDVCGRCGGENASRLVRLSRSCDCWWKSSSPSSDDSMLAPPSLDSSQSRCKGWPPLLPNIMLIFDNNAREKKNEKKPQNNSVFYLKNPQIVALLVPEPQKSSLLVTADLFREMNGYCPY